LAIPDKNLNKQEGRNARRTRVSAAVVNPAALFYILRAVGWDLIIIYEKFGDVEKWVSQSFGSIFHTFGISVKKKN
jgi:hypothetical protein